MACLFSLYQIIPKDKKNKIGPITNPENISPKIEPYFILSVSSLVID